MDVALRSVFVEEPAAFRIDAAHQRDALPDGADPRRPLAADPRRGRRLRNELAARARRTLPFPTPIITSWWISRWLWSRLCADCWPAGPSLFPAGDLVAGLAL